MKVLDFIHDYWVQIAFLVSIITGFVQLRRASKEATKCSLRNDILQIYSECRDKKEITLYQFEAIMLSYELYKKLKGNSFVQNIVEEVKTYKKV
jgi:hypothetical protein